MNKLEEFALRELRVFRDQVKLIVAPPAFDIHPKRKIEAYDQLAELCYPKEKK